MRVAEAFFSLQGEGVSTGVPAFFVRLAGCNLMCGGANGELVQQGKATWWCDSEKIWKGGREWTNEELEKELFRFVKPADCILPSFHMVWTGGEPTTKKGQQDITSFLDYFDDRFTAYGLYNEIETNGTLVVDPSFYEFYIDQVNCSPKLANSGIPKEQRINYQALKQVKAHPNGWFKFVISSEEDVKEIQEDFIRPLELPSTRVYIMPGVDRRADLAERTKMAWEVAMKYRFRLCTRLHILAYDRVLGV